MNAHANVSNVHRGAGDGPPVAVHASFHDEPWLGPLPEPSLIDRLRASWSLEALIPAFDRDRIEEPEWRPAGIITFVIHVALIAGIIVLSTLGIGRFVEQPRTPVTWLEPGVREPAPQDTTGGGAPSDDPGLGDDGGGGSNTMPKPATAGAPPAMKPSPPIVLPVIKPSVTPPALPVDPAVQGPTYAPSTTDPVGIQAPTPPGDPSAGNNGGAGIGNGQGNGGGSGNGPGGGSGSGGPGGGRPAPNGGGQGNSGGPTVGPNEGPGPGVANRGVRIAFKSRVIPTKAMIDTGTFGTVTIRVTVGPDGRIISYAPVQGLANGGTQAAIEALLRCKFLPAIQNGQYVTEKILVNFPVTMQ